MILDRANAATVVPFRQEARVRVPARSLQRSREYEEWLLNRKVPHDEESSYKVQRLLGVLYEGAARSHGARLHDPRALRAPVRQSPASRHTA